MYDCHQLACLGRPALWGVAFPARTENWKDRWEQLLRYRAMECESTDPLAIGLLHDIVLELEVRLRSWVLPSIRAWRRSMSRLRIACVLLWPPTFDIHQMRHLLAPLI